MHLYDVLCKGSSTKLNAFYNYQVKSTLSRNSQNSINSDLNTGTSLHSSTLKIMNDDGSEGREGGGGEVVLKSHSNFRLLHI